MSCLRGKESLSIKILLRRYMHVLTNKLGHTNLLNYDIKQMDNKPIKSSPHQLLPLKMKIMKEMIDQLLKNDVIHPRLSPYASPTFLVNRDE